MPAFPTPQPILLALDVQVGDIQIIATDRTDTVVTVKPRSAAKRADVDVAEAVTIDHTERRVAVVGPKRFSIIGPTGSITVTVELPTGSRVDGAVSYGGVRARGRLGDTRVKTSYGDLEFEATAAAILHTSGGDILLGDAEGDSRLSVGNGSVRVDRIVGSAVAKTANGEIVIGEVTGTLDASSSSGDIAVHLAGATTNAKTAYGRIRIGEAPRGSLRLESSYGEIEVGVPVGTAAWLDVSSGHGVVRSELQADDAPASGDKTVEVRARTKYGDVVIRRPLERRPGDRREPRVTESDGAGS